MTISRFLMFWRKFKENNQPEQRGQTPKKRTLRTNRGDRPQKKHQTNIKSKKNYTKIQLSAFEKLVQFGILADID